MAIFFLRYDKDEKKLYEQIFSQMRLCSYTLDCKNFSIDFTPKNDLKPYKLYEIKDQISAYFPIQTSQNHYLKIYLKQSKFKQQLGLLKKELFFEFLSVLIMIALLSLFFAYYTLRPMTKALKLTEEFIKDILHDFNTPLSTLRLNVAMLEKDQKNNKKIQRIENAVNTVLQLQSNLRAYLYQHKKQQEHFSLEKVIKERIELIQGSYIFLDFQVKIDPKVMVETNKEAFIRIIDNLLSNAAKYNKKNGFIKVTCKDKKLSIKDSGKGIANPKKVFERFYKEQERGIGIGLHIVAKLVKELGISIDLHSEVGVGTTFILDLKEIILK